MKLSDILIIYLSCGAPFGVYFFLHNRTKLDSITLIVQSLLKTFVWFPYAIRFLHDFVTNKLINYKFAKRNKSDSIRQQKIDQIEKEISNILFREKLNISLYDFRETFQRFAGLTIASQISIDTDVIGENEKEIFRIPIQNGAKLLKENVNVSAKCLNRRNQKRLKFHQINAREDFLKIIIGLNSKIVQRKSFETQTSAFVELLNDYESQKSIHRIFDQSAQTDSKLSVNELENEVWNSKQNKPASVKTIPLNLQTASATATIPKQD